MRTPTINDESVTACMLDIVDTFRHNVDVTASQLEVVLERHGMLDRSARRAERVVQRNTAVAMLNRHEIEVDGERMYIDCVRRGGRVNEARYRVKSEARHAQHLVVKYSDALATHAKTVMDRIDYAVSELGHRLSPELKAKLIEKRADHRAMTKIIVDHMTAEQKRMAQIENEIDIELRRVEELTGYPAE